MPKPTLATLEAEFGKLAPCPNPACHRGWVPCACHECSGKPRWRADQADRHSGGLCMVCAGTGVVPEGCIEGPEVAA